MSVHLMSGDELKTITALRAVKELHDLDKSYLQKLASIATVVEFAEGHIIHRAGDLGQAIYIIETGQVNIEVEVDNQKPVTVLIVGSGQLFGLSSLFPPQRKKGTARVVQPTRAIVIDSHKLRHLLASNHALERDFMIRVAQIINERVKATWLELAKRS
jgi:CRP/FNR family cyclic AMP-dependent transcriptional regulator